MMMPLVVILQGVDFWDGTTYSAPQTKTKNGTSIRIRIAGLSGT